MNLPAQPRIAIAGSVNSSVQTLKKLHKHGSNVVRVLGLHPEAAKNVSGYQDLVALGRELGYPSTYFTKLNEPDLYREIKDDGIDLLWVIGLSQMVREPLLSLAKYGNVGFHPTLLPQGRGRGAVAWIVLGKAPCAATFFLLDEGMDSGDILGQVPITVGAEDYAEDVIEAIKQGIDQALDELLPRLNAGELVAQGQDHSKATYLGQRKPQDGEINWERSAAEIHQLIRASSHPLPGAFTRINGEKLIIWRAHLAPQYTGVPGRIFVTNSEDIIIHCGEGAIMLEDFSYAHIDNIRTGLDCSYGK